MNVIAYTALLYGKDYLGYAIRSVIDHVDAYYCLYTPIGSHGHRTNIPCPDTRDELYAIAQAAAGSKLVWHEGIYPYEGAHREYIHQLAPDADLIIVVDADEIYHEGLVKHALFHLEHDGYSCRTIRLPIIHYFRSFYRCVLHDPAYPTRLIYPKANLGEMTWPAGFDYINHMGYAQRPEIVEYKQHTHGHRNEWRKDVDWFNDVFMANRQTDCHPVGSEYWNPEPVDPWDYLPEFMKQHPYANMEVIE